MEGLTDLHEILAAVIRAALADEALASGLKCQIADMQGRLDRLQDRAAKRRQIAKDVMAELDLKITAPDFTASLRPGMPALVVLNEDAVPTIYWQPGEPRLKRQQLATDLKDGAEAAKGGLGSLAAHLASAAAPSAGATIVATGSLQILDYIKSGRRTELPAASPAGAIVVRSVIEQAYDPAAMERMLRVEAMIDGRIAKVMGRLVNLKEYKSMYCSPATVLPSANAPALSPAASPGAELSAPVPSTNPLKWGDPG